MDSLYDFDPTIEVVLGGVRDDKDHICYYDNVHNVIDGFRPLTNYGFPNHSVNMFGQVINNVNGQIVSPYKNTPSLFKLTCGSNSNNSRQRIACDLRNIIGELFSDVVNPYGPYVDLILEVQEFYSIPLKDKHLVTSIEGYNYKLWVTRYGGVWRTNPIKKVHQYINATGYYTTDIYTENTYRNKKGVVHRLVAQYFCSKPDHLKNKSFEELTVNHKDGNKLNNNWWNLEWCTQLENMKHAVKTNLMKRSFIYKNKIKQLNDLLCQGYSKTEVSEITGIPIHTVRYICRLKSKSYNSLLTPELWT